MSRVVRPPTADVISRVAHDLRASLNALVSWGGALEAGPLAPEDIRRAGAAVTRQAHLTSRRLDLALDLWRLDQGVLDLTAAPVAATPLARAAVGACAETVAGRSVACSIEGDDGTMVMANGRRCLQALALLVEEAVAAAPVGGRVDLRVNRNGHDVHVQIVPDGGSTPREPSGPFTRTLAAAIIEAHGGRLDAGDGGAFDVTLPAAPDDPAYIPRDEG